MNERIIHLGPTEAGRVYDAWYDRVEAKVDQAREAANQTDAEHAELLKALDGDLLAATVVELPTGGEPHGSPLERADAAERALRLAVMNRAQSPSYALSCLQDGYRIARDLLTALGSEAAA
jgi:hypothetical protein